MAFDFLGDKPQGRITACISSTGISFMVKGLSANSHNAGVTWLTLSSVHCAESSTATKSVYGSVWSNGMGVSG